MTEPSKAASSREDAGLGRALEEARAGVSDDGLATLLVDHWRWSLEQEPLWATELGVHDFDDRIGDDSRAAVEARRVERRAFVARARAIDPAGLAAADRVHHALFLEQLEAAVAAEICDFEQWTLDPRDNPVTRFNHLPEVHRVETLTDARQLIARYQAIPAYIDGQIAMLELGASRGLYSTAESTRRVLDMVTKQIAQPLADWPLMAPVRASHADLPEDQLSRFREELSGIVEEAIKPALERYARLIEGRLLPQARGDDRSGLSSLPGGEACYQARIRQETTLSLDAARIHQIGLDEIAKLDLAIAALGEKSLGTHSLADTLARLRSDRALYFESEAEIEQAAERSLARAKERLVPFFGLLPKADCVVRRIPDYEAPYTTIAYYRPPHTDGSKPGEYYVNVLDPSVRPRFEARVLAVHESIPGHHLQIAIAQEMGGLPAFRKHTYVTPYVEGWALYTERLADEMGLYETDLDRMGMLSFDAWRAGRLVVDTGIHALGWSRSRAKQFLEEHTALSLTNIDNEVDRYISWPGQALGYKLGQLEIASLRERAEAQLGERFSLPAFHDVVLGGGAIALPVLRARVEDWLQQQLLTP